MTREQMNRRALGLDDQSYDPNVVEMNADAEPSNKTEEALGLSFRYRPMFIHSPDFSGNSTRFQRSAKLNSAWGKAKEFAALSLYAGGIIKQHPDFGVETKPALDAPEETKQERFERRVQEHADKYYGGDYMKSFDQDDTEWDDRLREGSVTLKQATGLTDEEMNEVEFNDANYRLGSGFWPASKQFPRQTVGTFEDHVSQGIGTVFKDRQDMVARTRDKLRSLYDEKRNTTNAEDDPLISGD